MHLKFNITIGHFNEKIANSWNSGKTIKAFLEKWAPENRLIMGKFFLNVFNYKSKFSQSHFYNLNCWSQRFSKLVLAVGPMIQASTNLIYIYIFFLIKPQVANLSSNACQRYWKSVVFLANNPVPLSPWQPTKKC